MKLARGLFVLGITAIVLTIVALFLGNNYSVYSLKGNSMYPTLEDGGVTLLKNVEDKSELEVDDIIVFNITDFDRGLNRGSYIKRVVGLPGDNISYSEYGLLTVNGEVVHINDIDADIPVIQKREYQLEDDELFVIGDNYTNSLDSRTFGAVKVDEVVGKLLFIKK